MKSSLCVIFFLDAVFAITNLRNDVDFDRRRQISFFNSESNKFPVSGPSSTFQQQPSISIIPNQPQNGQQFPPNLYQNTQTSFIPQSTVAPNIYLQNQNPIVQPNNLQVQPANPIFQNGFQGPNFQIGHSNPSFTNVQSSIAPSTNIITPLNNVQPLNNYQQLSQQPTQPAFLPTIPTQVQDQLRLGATIPLINQNTPLSFHTGINQNQFTQSQLQLQSLYEQQSKEIERLKELEERQKIIQKHKQFLERQQQKQQEKVEKLHQDFLNKQAKKQDNYVTTTTESYEHLIQSTQQPHREIQAHEVDLFKKAVKMFEDLHPTSSTTSTTTTTEKPTSKFTPRPKSKPRTPPSEQHKQKLYSEIRNLLEESETKGFDDESRAKSIALLQKPDIIKQLKLAIAENADLRDQIFTTKEFSLPNGQRIELIKTSDPNLIPNGAISADGSTLSQVVTPSPTEYTKQNKISFEDFTKDVIPPGTDYELIKQTQDGKLDVVDNIATSNKKKLTFVFLEEQNDGSYKVKGVKANGQEQSEGPDVENILKKIKNGEIQLPTNQKSTTNFNPSTPSPTVPYSPSTVTQVLMSNHGSTGHTNPIRFITTQKTPVNNYKTTTTPRSTYIKTTRQHSTYAIPTRASSVTISEKNWQRGPSLTQNTYSPIRAQPSTARNIQFNSPSTSPAPTASTTDYNGIASTYSTIQGADSEVTFTRHSSPSVVDILKENGLFATAKYLKQSGLDSILNETGPYTIFAPTDKAFRTLLVQLGGPDKAEEKFKDNPRLLSGLLLHHVIPGAFDIASLQDEMTGVSLAGTQLRVNQYDMHDVEWNEVKVTTINGARVVDEKKDISIPQGIAHAVDRVMFPLPVGDIVQTLQADRDRRFTTFLKAIYTSGFADTLSESKTYTVFAPTDAAFTRLSPAEATRLGERGAARALVARHVLPGTLYSAGMRYYQLKNSMEDSKQLTLQKNAGRIKVNNAQVITHNIPATNGVIHAVDTLL